jgi:large subunit ribosomal protein L6e
LCRQVNGVPIRRVNQSYTIVTSVVVSLDGVDVSKVDDAYFKRIANGEDKKPDAEKYAKWIAQRKQTQKAVDSVLIKSIAAQDKQLKDYLGARFSLQNGMAPHLMKF